MRKKKSSKMKLAEATSRGYDRGYAFGLELGHKAGVREERERLSTIQQTTSVVARIEMMKALAQALSATASAVGELGALTR